MLMGVERLRSITGELLARGAAPETPVALVRWGSTPRQETLTGRLDTIADLVAARGFKAPAVAVFGSVVTLRDELNWFEKRPLFGKRIVVTRTRQQAGKLSDRLTELGADVIEIPTIEIAPPTDRVQFVRMIADAHTYDWIVFTSANGVTAFFEAFFKLHKDARALGRPKLAAIGPATAAKVREYRFDVDLQPAEFVAESIVEAFKEIASVENETILVVQAEAGREIVAPALSEMGAIVDEVAAYTTLPVTTDATGEASRFREEGADIITFTSSSTVENFLALNLPWPTGMKTASIGPITSETMRQKGLQVDCEATRSDIPGLIEAIVKDLA
jgi:uroporphyrinogen III methyltransferase/synthase